MPQPQSYILGVGICLIFISATANAGPAAPVPVAATCQTCHGVGGDSLSGSVPRLNGQHAEYIVARLNNFLDPAREDPHATRAMWGVASGINEETFSVLANYYAGQIPTSSHPRGSLASRGKHIYEKGLAAPQIPTCASCHGPNGEGNGTVPRLAGQHAEYLTNQLERFYLTLRASDTMHLKTKFMTGTQIKALVSYLAND